MKIAAVGCSHTSYVDKCWPQQLASLLNAELVLGSSPGAGVGICVDKLCYILSTEKVDHVFFQAPADLRFCIGMNTKLKTLIGVEGNGIPGDLCNSNDFFTFIMTLVHGNKRALNRMVDNRTDDLWDKFDKIWEEYFFDNFYESRINFVKHLVQVQNLCKNHNVPYTMFTWHDFPWNDKNKLLRAWVDQIDRKNLISESVINFNKRNKRMDERECVYKEFSVDGYHLNAEGSHILAKDYILEFYKNQY